jgi:general secretion pathway protein A
MYTEYFGLKEAPFSIAPDPRYLYMSEQHREALAHLLFGVTNDGGFVLLTGEVGTGKTTVCRCLLEQMPENCDVAFIFNPQLTVRELLSTICDELRIKYPEGARSIKVFIDLINAYLLDAHAQGRKAVLIIDEAQRLSLDVLEQIRLLTNLETNQRKLLQVILLGQPELKEKLSQPRLRQLSQRIVARYHLVPLLKQDVAAYVNHRLSIAGLSGRLFPDAIMPELFRLSGGVPRLLNVLCDRALLGTYAQGKRSVDQETLVNAAREVFGEARRRRGVGAGAYGLLLAGLVVIGVALCLLVNYLDQRQLPAVANPAAVADRAPPLASEYRKPIPTHEQAGAEDPQTAKPADQEHQPQPPLDLGPMTALPPLAPENDPATTLEASANQKQESTAGSAPESAPLTLLEKFTDEARLHSEMLAHQTLLGLWGATTPPDSNPDSVCRQAEAKGLRCFAGRGDLDELRRLNVPAVLKLGDPRGQPFYVTLKALRSETATLGLGSETATVAVDELASLWNGRYTLLWRPPPQGQGSIREGDRGPAVKWLESRLRHVQGKAVPLRKEPVLDPPLVERVKLYQLSKGLKPVGVVGPKTLIHLSLDTSSKTPHLMEKD